MSTGVVIVSGQSLVGDWFQEGSGATSEVDGVITTLTVQELNNLTGYELADRIASGDTTVTDLGNGTVRVDGLLAADRFAIELLERESSTYDDIVVVRAASGGKAVLDESTNSEDHFFDSEKSGASSAVGDGDGDFDGPLMTDLVKPAIDDAVSGLSNAELIGVVWAQGEADDPTLDANAEGTTADDDLEALYKAGVDYTLNEIINYTLNTYPSVFSAQSVTPTAYIQHIGGRDGQDNGIDDVKTIQEELADENSNIVIATESYDLARQDSVHPTNESYQTAAERMAAFIADDEGGPRTTNVVLTSDDLADTATVTLELDFPSGFDGSDLDLGDDPGRFLAVFDETTDDNDGRDFEEDPIPVTNVQIVGDTVVFTLGRAIDGDGTVLYGYTTSNFDGANVVQPIYMENGDLDQPIYSFRHDFTESDYGSSAPDLTPPVLQPDDSTPADDDARVDPGQTFTLAYDEAVVAGTGSIHIYEANGTLAESFDVATDVTFNGAQASFTPTALQTGTDYYIQVDAGAVEDSAGNAAAAVTDTTTLNFTTQDAAPAGFDAGAIAFIGYNADDSSALANRDSFGFVALQDIPAGIEISFTDQGWDGSGFANNPSENTLVWTSPGITAGEVVTFNRLDSVQEASKGTTSGSSLKLSTSGDQIFAFTGPASDPTLLAGIQMNGDWDDNASNANKSDQPAALTGNNTSLAIDPEVDNAYYSGPASFTDADSARAAINDPSNWMTSNSGPIDLATWISSFELSADTVAPSLTSSTPGDDAVDVAPTAPIELVFDETIQAGAGTIQLRRTDNGSLVESFDISSDVAFSGNTVTLTPSAALDESTGFYVTISAGAITDAAGNDFGGISDSTTLNFITADITAPALVSQTPVDDATSVAITTNLAFEFDETVQGGTSGDIEIRQASDDALVERFAAGSSRLSFSGTILVIDPTAPLTSETEYYVTIASGAVTDASGNAFSGITDTTSISFTTADIIAPVLVSQTPVDDATNVATTSNLELEFDEAVQGGTSGNIEIRQTSDDALIERFEAGSSRLSFSGTTLVIDPTAPLASETEYYVTVATGAITDASGNAFAGITDTTSISFTTADEIAPSLTDLSPDDDSTNVSVASTFTLTFDEPVQAGSGGLLVLHRASDGAVVETFDPSGGSVSFDGSSVTLTPSADLEFSTGFYVTVDNGAIADLSGNDFAGWNDSTTFSVTTAGGPDTSAPSVVATLPADDSTQIATTSNIVYTFDEPIAAGSGTVTIALESTGTVVETIAIDSARITIAGDVLTIDPVAELAEGTSYTVTLSDGAITDLAGNAFLDGDGANALSFTTAGGPSGGPDVAPPTLTSTLSDDPVATDQPSFSFAFSEAIEAGSGYVNVKRSSDNALIERIYIGEDQVTVSGDTLEFTLSEGLASGTEYYIQLSDDLVSDAAGNSLDGVTGSDALVFTTEASSSGAQGFSSSIETSEDEAFTDEFSSFLIYA